MVGMQEVNVQAMKVWYALGASQLRVLGPLLPSSRRNLRLVVISHVVIYLSCGSMEFDGPSVTQLLGFALHTACQLSCCELELSYSRGVY